MRTTLLLLACGLLLPQTFLAQETFDIEPITDGVYAALVHPQPPMYVFANALIVINDADVLVVDTHQSPSAARTLLAEIRKLTDKPVRTVVNTHWHGDHVYGNQVYAEAFPGQVEFIAHHTTREDVLTRGAAYVQKEINNLPESIRQREAQLASGETTDGQLLTEVQKQQLRRGARLRAEYLAELQALHLTPPTLTFEHKLVLHRGGRTIHLLYFGRAHTRGDVVVYLPKEKVLAAGDLLEDAFPYLGHSYPSGWATALQELAKLEADSILPSHGPLLRDKELLALETELFVSLVEQVRKAIAQDLSLKETQQAVSLEKFRAFFTGGDPKQNPAFERNVAQAVERAYRETKGALED